MPQSHSKARSQDWAQNARDFTHEVAWHQMYSQHWSIQGFSCAKAVAYCSSACMTIGQQISNPGRRPPLNHLLCTFWRDIAAGDASNGRADALTRRLQSSTCTYPVDRQNALNAFNYQSSPSVKQECGKSFASFLPVRRSGFGPVSDLNHFGKAKLYPFRSSAE